MIPIDNLSLTSLILPFLIGTMLGCCFFYALWFTVKKKA